MHKNKSAAERAYKSRRAAQTNSMMTRKELWTLFERSGRVEFYNAYRALSDKGNVQESHSDSDKGGAV